MTQKSAVRIHFAVEAWNHAKSRFARGSSQGYQYYVSGVQYFPPQTTQTSVVWLKYRKNVFKHNTNIFKARILWLTTGSTVCRVNGRGYQVAHGPQEANHCRYKCFARYFSADISWTQKWDTRRNTKFKRINIKRQKWDCLEGYTEKGGGGGSDLKKCRNNIWKLDFQ